MWHLENYQPINNWIITAWRAAAVRDLIMAVFLKVTIARQTIRLSYQQILVLDFSSLNLMNLHHFPFLQLAGLSSSFFMRYNDTTVHSVPVGVNILGSILHMNALKSQNLTPYPLEANILPFPGLKPQWTSFTSILLIVFGLALIPGGFAIDVVALRQVSYIIKGGGGEWVRLVQSRDGREKGGRK